ncbi:MAG: hypothetical protein KBA61_00165 [Spirochaetes bacterium]|nr:hypothetical protein [Spirochaetota bacterium]
MKLIDTTLAKIRAKAGALNEAVDAHNRNIAAEAKALKDLAFSDQYNNYFAAVSFVPFVGWLIPLYLKKDDPFCQDQAKTGFYMALLFTTLALAIIFVGIFLSRDWRVARLIQAILVYLTYLVYFGFCAYGAHASINNRQAELINRIPLVMVLRGMIVL